MNYKNRKRIFVLLSLLVLSIIIPVSWAIADNWKILNDDSLCDEGWYNDRKGVCEVRELNIKKKWDSISVDASPNGGISVEGWDNKNIRVKAIVKVKAESNEEAREILSNIDILTTNNTINARGPKLSKSRRSWTVSYRIMVPQNMDLNLTALNGGISIQNVNGELDLKTLNGGIKLKEISGDVDARTTNGGINAVLDGKRWRGKGMELHTTNGSVKLTIPKNYSAELEAGTVNGGIKIDFPVKVQGWIKKSLKTTLGKGGAPIKARTINGSINIKNG